MDSEFVGCRSFFLTLFINLTIRKNKNVKFSKVYFKVHKEIPCLFNKKLVKTVASLLEICIRKRSKNVKSENVNFKFGFSLTVELKFR